MITFICNRSTVTSSDPGGRPVLDWIREQHNLKGTKEGCREGDCGACTVVLGKPVNRRMEYNSVCSCLLPMAELQGAHLVTIEGISRKEGLTPFQQEFFDQAASQCGFCTPGMIMSLTGFLLGTRKLTLENAMESLDGNICRCTGYAAVQRAVENVMTSVPEHFADRLEMLISEGHVPGYFSDIPEMLHNIGSHSPDGRGKTLVAGGTDVYVHPDEQLVSSTPAFILVPDGISVSSGTVTVGAGATVNSLRNSEVLTDLFPDLDGFLRRISSTQIRSRATVGGNIMNGSPIGDLAVLFLALNGTVHTCSSSIPLSEFYLGYKKFRIEKDEIVNSLTFPVPEKGEILSALKVCKREYLDIASVNSACLIKLSEGRIISVSMAAGGVAPFPLLLKNTAEILRGNELTEELITSAGNTAASEISPISDIRGSKEYKTELLKSQIRVHLTRGISR